MAVQRKEQIRHIIHPKADLAHHEVHGEKQGSHEFAIEGDSMPIDDQQASRPSLSTLLSIGFLGLSVVGPIACGFLVATAILVDIGVDLGDTVDIGWVVTSWSIASSVTFAIAGSLSDIFGRRNVILAGQLVSLVGAIVAGVAKTTSMWIGGSALLGFSTGLVLVAYAAVPEILPNRYRGIGLAWTEGALHIPWGALAVLLGQVFVLRATWRWVYYISAIYAAVSLIGTAVFYHPPRRPQHDESISRWQQFAELDFIAIGLYASGLTSFLLGLSWAGSAGHPWRSASVIAPLVLGALGFIACFVYDFTIREKSGKHIMFPRSLLTRIRKYTVSLVVVFVAGMVYYSMSALLPQATGYIFTSDPIRLGVTLLPNGLGQMTGACIVPLFLHRTRHPKWYIIAAITVQTFFTGMYAYGVNFHKGAWMAFQYFGQGCFALITITTVFNSGLWVEPAELGITVGLLGTFRSMGGSVGNAIFSTILRNRASSELPKLVAGAAVAHGYAGNTTDLVGAIILARSGVPKALAALDPSIEVQDACFLAFKEAYARAFQTVFLSTIPFGIIALCAAICIKDASELMTSKVQVVLQRDVLQWRQHADKDLSKRAEEVQDDQI